jgi:uncharacterized membrane protein YeaQ/YmgE (transglycosylase-associated protein family)
VGVIFLIVAGSIFGWLAAIIACAEDGRGLPLNILAGVMGALLAGLVLGPLIGEGNLVSGDYDVGALLLGVAGSAALLIALNLLRRHTAQ